MQTNVKHFRLFEKYFNEYVRKFGLLDWTIYCVWESITGYAGIHTEPVGRAVTATLNTEWDARGLPLDEESISLIAKHEACHLLVADLNAMASSRYVTEDEVRTTEEALVCRLEKLL